jgi:cardiolipin synthase
MEYPAWTGLIFIGEFLIRLAMVILVLLRRRGNPSVNLTWILVILAVPVLGAIAYAILGTTRLGRKRVRQHADIHQRVMAAALKTERADSSGITEVDPLYRHLATLVETVGGTPVRRGNALRLIGDTDVMIQGLVEDIDSAQHHCHLLFYIFLDDHSGTRVAEALMRAAQRGVACRLLVDGVGSGKFLRSKLCQSLEAANVKVQSALPVNAVRMLFARLDLRNHRKLVVIDNAIGYTGSSNIADPEFTPKPKYAPWVDAMVRIEGPITRDLQILFAEDWYLDTQEPLDELLDEAPPAADPGVPAQLAATGPTSFTEALRHLTQVSLHAAREELIMTTPYFVPDEATATALETAASRGIETSLVVPARNDSPLVAAASRSHYEPLLESGVRIYEFQPGLLHAKTLTIDRNVAIIGTANMDRRSFELNFEITLAVYHSDFASQLRFLQRSYIAESQELTSERWSRRGLTTRLWHNTAGMVSPLL